MRSRVNPWLLAVLVVILIGASGAIIEWRRIAHTYSASRLVGALPLNGAVKLYVDLAQLRDGGILNQIIGEKGGEDSEYRRLTEQLGFDYRTDIDAIAVAFVNNATYAVVKGRFDWKRFTEYAQSHQGSCNSGVCSMPGTEPKRTISFHQLDTSVLAWAETDQPEAVQMIRMDANRGITVPEAVIWLSAPGPAFKNPQNALPGTRPFLTPLAEAREASFSVAPKPSGNGSPFEIRMSVTCTSPQSALELAGDLATTTDVFRGTIVNEKLSPGKGSLARVLVAGRFEAHESTVNGVWPLDREVIQNLSTGQIR